MKHIYLMLLALSLWQCTPPTEIGASFFPDESFLVEEVEPLDVMVTSYLLDSVVSTNNERLLVGRHADAEFGVVEALTFSQFMLDDLLPLDEDGNYRYDSLTLYLEYDGYAFYDTLEEVHLSVHQLAEPLELDVDKTDFYTFDEFDFSDLPLAQLVFRPRPRRAEPLEIRLSDAFGLRFFQLLQAEDDRLLSTNDFLDLLPGLVLQVNNENGAVVGFRKSSAQIRMYLTDVSTLPLQQELRTYSAEFGFNFNQILVDRDDSALERLESEEGVSSVETEGLGFLQAGGVAVRIDIPDIPSLIEDKQEFIVAEAELRFRAVGTSIDDQESLPRTIQVFWAETDNARFLQNSEARLVMDAEFGRDTYYTLDVTDFVQFQLTAENPNENGLLLQFGTSGNAVDRLIIGDGDHPDAMALRLYTLNLKE